MAQIPPIKRLLVQDFPDQKEWISKLLLVLNQFMESVSNAFSKGLTVNENMDGQVKNDLVVTEGSEPFFFTPTTKTRPLGVAITGHINLTGTSPSISSALYADWEYQASQNQIKIKKIYGLNAGEKYQLTVFVHTK